MTTSRQLDLFTCVADAYAGAAGGELSNDALYAAVAHKAEISADELDHKKPIGRAGAMRSTIKRQIRWYQQTLKQLGVIERMEGSRGIWRMCEPITKELDRAADGVKLVAFHTDLGIAIWAECKSVFGALTDTIHLCVTSPPYPLRQSRAYGNPDERAYVDFLCSSLEPIVRNLARGGSIVLNLSSDIFESKSPARSLFQERLVLALHDRLGLFKMDMIPWVNYSKPPAPTYWACVNRVQLTTAYEPIYWFTNDPSAVRSDNRRVLEAHTERHQMLMARGGEQRITNYGDGAYRLREGSFGDQTSGKIPRNVIERGHVCLDTKAYKAYAKGLGLPMHGAMYPTAIPDFFIRLLTEPDDLVVDPFGGTIKTGLAAERLGRRWIVTEWIMQYIRGAAGMFQGYPGYGMHCALV